jgi:hypothetical protein
LPILASRVVVRRSFFSRVHFEIEADGIVGDNTPLPLAFNEKGFCHA